MLHPSLCMFTIFTSPVEMTGFRIAGQLGAAGSPGDFEMVRPLAEQAHRRAVDASVDSLAGFLQTLLSRRVTAYIAGVRDAKTITRWANGQTVEIRDYDMEQRLRTAYAIGQMLTQVDNDQTVKSWFVSLNPYLGNISPAEAIREGRGGDALAAAQVFRGHG